MATGELRITGQNLSEPDYVVAGQEYARATYPALSSLVGIDGLGVFVDTGISTSENMRSIIWSDSVNLFIVVGNNGEIFTSPDGETWTARTSGTTGYFWRVIEGETSHFFAVTLTGVIKYSANGTSWGTATSPTGNAIYDMCYDASRGKYFAVATSGQVYESTGYPFSWAANTSAEGLAGTETMRGAVAHNGTIILCGNNGIVLRSTNGSSFSDVSTPNDPVESHYSVVVDPVTGDFYLGSNKGIYRSTDDGVNWTKVYEREVISDSIWDISVSGGVIYASSVDYMIITSVDGINWVEHPDTIETGAGSVYQTASDGTTLVAAGAAGFSGRTLLSSAPNFFVPPAPRFLNVPEAYNVYVET